MTEGTENIMIKDLAMGALLGLSLWIILDYKLVRMRRMGAVMSPTRNG